MNTSPNKMTKQIVTPMREVNPSANPKASKTRTFWTLLGLLLLTGHIIFFTWHTDRAAQSFNRSTVPPDTITGVPEPRFFLETDSYAWLAHTRDLMNSDAWRLRWTHMDNAPVWPRNALVPPVNLDDSRNGHRHHRGHRLARGARH